MQTLDQNLQDLVKRNIVSQCRGARQGREQGQLRGLTVMATASDRSRHASFTIRRRTMEREQAVKFMHDLLRLMRRKKASDLFITAGFPPAIKIDGKMTPVSQPDADAAAHRRAGARDHERQAGGRFEATKECNFAISPGGHRPLPRQRLRAAGPRRHGAADHHHHDPEVRRPEPAAGAEGRRDDQARPGDLGRRHRLGQIDLAGGDDRLPQREQLRPHHHHRGPGRVRAPAQELHRSPSAKSASTPIPGTPR